MLPTDQVVQQNTRICLPVFTSFCVSQPSGDEVVPPRVKED